MDEYEYTIKIIWEGIGIEGENKEQAREALKDLFAEEHNLALKDSEITMLERVKK